MSEIDLTEIKIGAPIEEPIKEKETFKKDVFEVGAMNIVGTGSAVVAAVACLTATFTYKSGTKGLVQDGINPAVRVSLIPLAGKTLFLSTMLTGAFGTLGFYLLKEQGFFKHDKAELLTSREMARIARNPKKYWQEITQDEEK